MKIAAVSSICKTLRGVRCVVSEESKTERCGEDDNAKYLRMHARPNDQHANLRPTKCPGYDRRFGNRVRRAGSVPAEVEAVVSRVQFPQHGVVTTSVPWAYEESRFTKDFDLHASWPAAPLSRSAVSEYMGIDRAAVGDAYPVRGADPEPA